MSGYIQSQGFIENSETKALAVQSRKKRYKIQGIKKHSEIKNNFLCIGAYFLSSMIFEKFLNTPDVFSDKDKKYNKKTNHA